VVLRSYRQQVKTLIIQSINQPTSQPTVDLLNILGLKKKQPMTSFC